MGIARHLEERLERLVDGMSAAVFGGKMHPVDLGNRLVRFADLHAEESWIGRTIPNTYVLAIARSDLAEPDAPPATMAALSNELAHTLRLTAQDEGWATRGPIAVSVERANEPDKTTVRSGSQPGPQREWGQLIAVRGTAAHSLEDNRVGVGRSTDAAVRLDVREVSRQHAIVYRHGGRHWVVDVGSTNGTWHNNHRVDGPTSLSPGDMIRFGPATFTFRVL